MAYAIFPSNQDRLAVAGVSELHGGANDPVILSLRKNNPARVRAHLVENHLQRTRGWIQAGGELPFIHIHVLNRPLCDAGIHGGLRDRRGHGGDQPRIERNRDDVVIAVLKLLSAIRGGDFFRHILAGQFRECFRRGDFHLVVNARSADIEGASKDIGEAQDIVHLIRIVGAAGRNDRVIANFLHVLRRNLWIGICHGKNDRLIRHRFHHILRDDVFGRQADKHIGADKRLRQVTGVSLDGMGGFPLVHTVFSATINDAAAVAHDDILILNAHALNQLDACDGRCARSVYHQFNVAVVPVCQVQGIDEPSRGDNGRSVLVVMKNRNLEFLFQALLDQETFGCLDIFEVDPAIIVADEFDAIDEFVDILGSDLDVDSVDVREAFEKNGFPFHHRFRRECADIAKTEHRRAVGDHRDEVTFRGVVVCGCRIGFDLEAGIGHARRISERQIALRGQCFGRIDLDLTMSAAANMKLQCVFPKRGLVGHLLFFLLLSGSALSIPHRRCFFNLLRQSIAEFSSTPCALPGGACYFPPLCPSPLQETRRAP